MSTSVTMPQLGESVTEGTVTRWLKQEGDEVTADEPLLEVSTDKVDTEIPSPASGVLRKIVVAEDETVQIGAELAVIGDAGDADSDGDDSDGADSDGGESASSDSSGETEQQADYSEDASEDAGEDADSEDAQADAESDTGSADDQSAQHDTEQDSSADASADSSAEEGAAPQSGGGGSSGGTSFTMPALGESVTEGTVTRWLKAVGDSVEVDEPLVEVSTDKVDTEIPAPSAGTLLSIAVAEDETVQVGAELGVIGSADGASGTADKSETDQAPDQEAEAEPAGDEDQSDSAGDQSTDPAETESAEPAAAEKEAAPAEAEAAEPAPARREDSSAAPDAEPPSDSPSTPAAAAPTASGSEATGSADGSAANSDPGAYVTPLVRKLAAEHKVDLSALTGTGVGGRIRKQDVLDAAAGASQPSPAATPDPAPAESAAPVAAKAPAAQPDSGKRGQTEKLTRLRALIGKRMIESLQVSAQLTTVVEVDVTRVARLRDRVKAEFLSREGVKLSFLPFFALAAVESLKTHPTVNSSIDSEAGTVTYHDSENLGIAVDTERGLLVPVVQDAGDLNLGGLARKIADLAERTRSNQVTPDELGGGTFTLTNTGSRGALFDTPIINQPQVAILGTGTVVKRAVVVDDPELGEIVTVRSMVYLALTYDHRIVDGADAARFLVAMKDRLETGDFESSLGLS